MSTDEGEHTVNAETIQFVSVVIGLVVVVLGVLVWLISFVVAGTEAERLKHETCMVVTETHTSTLNEPTVTVTEYCGPQYTKDQPK